MKIHLLSDLHCEYAPFKPDADAVDAADVVVLAGDIHHADYAVQWAHENFHAKLNRSHPPIIQICGNHEFYGDYWHGAIERMRNDARGAGIHFLENDRIDIKGVAFLGCTMWTNFNFFGEQARGMKDYEKMLADCRKINVEDEGDPRKLEPNDVLIRYEESIEWLDAELDRARREVDTVVVVTHHLPHRWSVAKKWAEDPATPGFANDLPTAFLARADLWLHGHTHDSCSYRLVNYQAARGVEILCNPRGYPMQRGGFENAAFDPGLLVEVGNGKPQIHRSAGAYVPSDPSNSVSS